MHAAYITETGPPDIIQWGPLPDPVPGPEEVLIATRAVSVNPIDTYIRGGAVAMELPTPFIPGCDAAGVVETVGSDVHRIKPGDRVWTTNQGLLGRQGTFAEKIAVNQAWVFPMADGVSFEDAAACGLVSVTAHLGLFREAQLEPGESVLVIGGAGGVGSMVVQMAVAAGASVIATGGTVAKRNQILAMGADAAIDYTTQSICEATRQLHADGVNVVWETRREPDFQLAVDVLAGRGRMILMAGRDATPPFPVGPFYVNECSVHGFVMFKATPMEMRQAADDLQRWMADGKVKANIGVRRPLREAAQAHAIQEASTLSQQDPTWSGKIVLTVS
ncbi:MAG: NADPH:quinone reductase [Planctomycetota bacterium]